MHLANRIPAKCHFIRKQLDITNVNNPLDIEFASILDVFYRCNTLQFGNIEGPSPIRWFRFCLLYQVQVSNLFLHIYTYIRL